MLDTFDLTNHFYFVTDLMQLLDTAYLCFFMINLPVAMSISTILGQCGETGPEYPTSYAGDA